VAPRASVTQPLTPLSRPGDASEDGISIDQIVLSADRFATAPPGAVKNDGTIVPR
jgi:hypothetical protein